MTVQHMLGPFPKNENHLLFDSDNGNVKPYASCGGDDKISATAPRNGLSREGRPDLSRWEQKWKRELLTNISISHWASTLRGLGQKSTRQRRVDSGMCQ